MISPQLTNRLRLARTVPMQGIRCANEPGKRGSIRRDWRVWGLLAGWALALGGCVSVNAPDKPIVIELNINIKQEVVYRLAPDAEKTINENPGVF